MRFYIQTIILNVLGDPESKFVRGRVYRGGLEGGGGWIEYCLNFIGERCVLKNLTLENKLNFLFTFLLFKL